MTRARSASLLATAVLGFMLLYLFGESLDLLASPEPRHGVAFLMVIGCLLVVRASSQCVYLPFTAAVLHLRSEHWRDVQSRCGIRIYDDVRGVGDVGGKYRLSGTRTRKRVRAVAPYIEKEKVITYDR